MTLFVDSKIMNVYSGVKYWQVHSVPCYLQKFYFQAKMSDKQITYNDMYQELAAQFLFLDNLSQI